MEGAGTLHGVGCAGNFCLELGKEGEGDAEFSAACRGRHGTLRILGSPCIPPECPKQEGHSPPSQHTGMFPLTAFPAELLKEIVSGLQAALVRLFFEENQGRQLVVPGHQGCDVLPCALTTASLGCGAGGEPVLQGSITCLHCLGTVHPAHVKENSPPEGEQSSRRRNYFGRDWKIPSNSCPSSFPTILEGIGPTAGWELQGHERHLQIPAVESTVNVQKLRAHQPPLSLPAVWAWQTGILECSSCRQGYALHPRSLPRPCVPALFPRLLHTPSPQSALQVSRSWTGARHSRSQRSR